MTSSYTTNKGLEKPGYNDYINSWNVPLNTDMDIVDTAFGGTYSVALTNSNVTLTQANCQYARIRLTGVLSANVTIYFPSGVGGFFVVQNATTGSYTVTLASVGGGTSVLATQSQSSFVFSDGTNITYCDDVRLQLTAGTGISITGSTNPVISLTVPVAIANGGTNATTAAGALSSLGAVPLAGGTMTGILYNSAGISGTTVSSQGFGIRVAGGSGDSQALIQFTNYAQNSQWASISSTSGAITLNATNSYASGNFTASGNVTAYSDVKLKKNVATIYAALDKVKAMRGVSYTNVNTDVDGIGVIAQEMQAICPQVVQDNNGVLSVAYGNLVGVLIEAIKELSNEVNALKGN
jgi:Chaperone of endosialidase